MAVTASIRKFRWEDLDQFTLLFNTLKGLTQTDKEIDVELLRQMLSHPACDADENGFVADLRGTLAGFVLVGPETRIGRAVLSGGVLPSYRRQGLGGRLLRAAIKHSQTIGASMIHAQVPEEGRPGCYLLEQEGFQVVRRYSDMTWHGGPVRRLELPEGHSLHSFKLGVDEEALTRLQNASFGGSWGFCPNTVEEISARVRFKGSDAEGIVFVMDGERHSAYTWTSRSSRHNASSGRIEMTGVHPSYRRRGLGRLAVLAGVAHLLSKGVESIDLEVDTQNAPAIGMYRSLGFREVRQTLWYELRQG